jgi:hypothetical protein
MTKKLNAAMISKILGILLAMVALIFIGNSIWSQKTSILLLVDFKVSLTIILAGALIYLIANILLSTAWAMLLSWFGETKLNLLISIQIYGKSQILKYIPGNLLSLPGRHILSIQNGAEHGPVAGAAVFEIMGLFAVASSISALGIIFTKWRGETRSLLTALVIMIISLISPIVLKKIFSYEIVLQKMPVFRTIKWGTYPRLLSIWFLYVCFFALTSTIMLGSITALGKLGNTPFYIVFFAFGISWLLGTITPGAPAGAGVRDGMIILILSGSLGEPTSILVSLIMRITTILGDVIFYFTSLYLEKRQQRELNIAQIL